MIRRTFLKGAAAVSFSLMVSPALTAFAKDSVRVYVGGPIFTMNKNNDIAEAIAVKGETIMRREMNQKIPYWSFPFSDSSSGVDLIFSSSTFPTACSPSGLQNASISSLNSGFSL